MPHIYYSVHIVFYAHVHKFYVICSREYMKILTKDLYC